eukprot:s113_g26.t3
MGRSGRPILQTFLLLFAHAESSLLLQCLSSSDSSVPVTLPVLQRGSRALDKSFCDGAVRGSSL